jgi:hypothetical protein
MKAYNFESPDYCSKCEIPMSEAEQEGGFILCDRCLKEKEPKK